MSIEIYCWGMVEKIGSRTSKRSLEGANSAVLDRVFIHFVSALQEAIIRRLTRNMGGRTLEEFTI